MPKFNQTSLKKYIREIPDYPKKGILFYDVTTLFSDPTAFRKTCSVLTNFLKTQKITKIVGIESRGFILGAVLAYNLHCGFVPVRKKGKLPYKTLSCDYKLEYGEATLEIHRDAIKKGDRVVIADDLLATGGTAKAAGELVTKLGGKIVNFCFLIELDFLRGRDKLKENKIISLLHYQS
ncbi:adenine phosphoribosyltransferase [candidate division WWE3 bacterium RIFCSPHIGHO2_01_FULL_43_9]|uniref:Adenine phosphoribosyltransferase n=1 Tax=candidate division WWE3 bacterium RIFCSPHIGHO2_01_FULL_43_9 TaxID=1802618 RepID=A0A1F4V938_UNCKA|nr:MAG: adenine phosphoribosyltransferase [candidate division WWE3 bacterium RIFCSPHIGHO2_01_FULL_43_9]